ncbi:hypothetical protein Mpsy_2314 [Methanolobus psychrophilus R15]|nr:hypothetical protein Mpsy_2314 [Methanolobus psychrophilus R15]
MVRDEFDKDIDKLIDVNFKLFSMIKNENDFANLVKEKLFNNI